MHKPVMSFMSLSYIYIIAGLVVSTVTVQLYWTSYPKPFGFTGLPDIPLETSMLAAVNTTNQRSIASKFRATYNLTYMDSLGVIQPRVFPVFGRPIPCYPNEPNWNARSGTQASPRGFFFHKPFKVGSSTAAGIHLRIAFNEANRKQYNFSHCLSRFNHHSATRMFEGRNRSKSFLWTIFRDPTERLISHFFHFIVSRAKKEPSDDQFIAYANKTGSGMYFFKSAPSGWITSPIETGNRLMEDYDFIGITERWDESMVALSMILDIPVSDVLHVAAKQSGGYDDAGGREIRICTYIVPSFVSPGMREFFASKTWWDKVHPDLQVYRAANVSLDRTIAALDQTIYAKRLVEYRQMKRKVKDSCEATTVFPCDSAGRLQSKTDCLWSDLGCGHKCMNRLFE